MLFARIYSGKQQLSWHGTTVHLLQPQPQQLLDEVTVSTELPFKRLHSSLTPHTSTGKPIQPFNSEMVLKTFYGSLSINAKYNPETGAYEDPAEDEVN